jgi:hypothetical protein
MDDFSFVETVDRFGEGVVVRVADAADGRLDSGFGEPLGVFDRNILGAAIARWTRLPRLAGLRS